MRIKLISVILAVVICFLSFFKLLVSYPSIFLNTGFDGQTILVWKYAAEKGLLPFKDVFYPYGLLNYYVNVLPLFTFLNAIILFFVLLFILIGFIKLFRFSMYALFSFALVILVGFFDSGVSAFLRYGVSAVVVILIVILMFQKWFAKRLLFLVGVVSGSCLFLIIDQGIYIFITFISLAILGKLLGYKWGKKYLVFLVGFSLSLVLFAFIFQSYGILQGFIVQLLRTSDISLYAKTPYFHSLRNINEIFNVSVLFVSTWYVVYTILFRRKAVNRMLVAMFSLSVLFFLIEQKSIIRFLGHQVDFIAVMMLSLLIYNIVVLKVKKLDSYIIFPTLILLIFSVVFLLIRPLPGYTAGVLKETRYIVKDPLYLKIVTFLKKRADFGNKLFSLPNDPELYIVTGQNPPYFFSTYDGSPEYAQENSIRYMNSNKINYVVYNTQASPLQDGVPDSIRAAHLYKFVADNYKLIKRIGNYLILERR